MSFLARTPHPRRSRGQRSPCRRVWAWPLAILLGFPIGGYVANMIVGKIDSVGAALAGGLIAGAIIGAAQWLALRAARPVALDRRDERRDGRRPRRRRGARRLRHQPRRLWR